MRRRLANLLTVVSLFFAVATAAIWWRSYWSETIIMRTVMPREQLTWRWNNKKLHISCGSCLINSRTFETDDQSFAGRWALAPDTWTLHLNRAMTSAGVPDVKGLGFSVSSNVPETVSPNTWDSSVPPYLGNLSYFRFPIWILTALSLVFPMCVAIRRHHARYVRRHQICRHCGYDLRATPQRCPECGTTPDPLPVSRVRAP